MTLLKKSLWKSVIALQSSLWEALGLEQHYLHSVATLAKSLEAPLSTENSVRAPFLRVDDFLGHTYESLMQTELATAKRILLLLSVNRKICFQRIPRQQTCSGEELEVSYYIYRFFLYVFFCILMYAVFLFQVTLHDSKKPWQSPGKPVGNPSDFPQNLFFTFSELEVFCTGSEDLL